MAIDSWFAQLENGFFHRFLYVYQRVDWPNKFWLVVSTILKILVNGKDYPIYYGKIKSVPNHQPEFHSQKSHSHLKAGSSPELVHCQLVVFGAIWLLRPENPGKNPAIIGETHENLRKILEILGKFINGGLSWENHGEIQEKMRIFMGKSSIGLLCRLPTGKAPWKSTGNHRPSYVKSLACRPRVIWGSQWNLNITNIMISKI